jgi:hypothetical protein
MHLRARSARKDPLDVLHELVQETIDSFNSVCELFTNDEKALRYFKTNCYGYMSVSFPVPVLQSADWLLPDFIIPLRQGIV